MTFLMLLRLKTNVFKLVPEEFWQRQGGDDFAVSFAPSASDGVAFWINAATKKCLRSFMDYSIDDVIFRYSKIFVCRRKSHKNKKSLGKLRQLVKCIPRILCR